MPNLVDAAATTLCIMFFVSLPLLGSAFALSFNKHFPKVCHRAGRIVGRWIRSK